MKIVPVNALTDSIGEELGPTEWFEVGQEQINDFADVTRDHQFIHVNPELAAQTPFGGTIAHGFFTLSLLAKLQGEAMIIPEGISMGVNYGLNKVRFLTPVRSGKRIRGRTKLIEVKEKNPGQLLLTNEVTVEVEGEPKPALIAEALTLYFV
ncbi:MAG: MaoC family dehydratase [Pseudomonadota bacterium]